MSILTSILICLASGNAWAVKSPETGTPASPKIKQPPTDQPVGSSPSAPPARPTRDVSVQCGDQTTSYSDDGYQYAYFANCLSTSGNNLNISIVAKGFEYKWGSAWYNNKYDSQITGDVVVQRDGATITSKQISQHFDGTSVSVDFSVPAPVPGKYTVIFSGQINGGYWSDSVSSVVKAKNIEFSIPKAQ
ncbi:hypothetical protein WS62_06215 [Burkholderia sp. ABCPW 14]|nr:hypothetical protein WS62_06215 [Burkholderia sp. ABCPW 14]